jgi:sporulation protein YlmC with PRC-barrel domain
MTEKEFLGKTVVSISDGAKVGTIKDLVFDGSQVKGFIVKGERGEGLLPFSALGTPGPDAIAIESYELVDWNAGKLLQPASKTLNDLLKLSVVDDSGAMIGHMHDLTFDSAGYIEQIAVRTEGVFGIGAHHTLVPGKRIRALGPSFITVESEPAPAHA